MVGPGQDGTGAGRVRLQMGDNATKGNKRTQKSETRERNVATMMKEMEALGRASLSLFPAPAAYRRVKEECLVAFFCWSVFGGFWFGNMS